ncbi:MAG: hypothetical protein HZC02_00235 [Candidatus Levybacteria bacterium]|nr:hypothetical protein [Candidatus Levybacteria bacterium]
MFDGIDQKKLLQAIVVVIAFGVFALSLTYIVPLLGLIAAVSVVGAIGYALYLFFTGKKKV